MRILVIGSGGREHALTWRLHRAFGEDEPASPHELFVAPGNGGTAGIARNLPIAVTDVPGLVRFASEQSIDLTLVGPEAPLVAGLVDAFGAAGLRAFGPTAAAARLEGSKAFAKTFMVEEGIPTAPAQIFDRIEDARAALAHHTGPIVVKASGLAAGKGVLICATREEAEAALHRIMVERAFGDAGDRVLLETCLEGEEVSLLAFSDGTTVVPMPAARDYKRALDGDAGLNTGGMGGYAPSPHLTPQLVEEITARVLQPTVDGMRRRGTPYVGVLYAGLMLTAEGPQVLEFNARFGDPETQILMPLLETDLARIALACLDGKLHEQPIRWRDAHSVSVVMAAGGYPGAYRKGDVIDGLEAANAVADVVFHAGTRREGDRVLTDGGRVLAVTATGPTLQDARDRAYSGVEQIHFADRQVRTDIAAIPAAASTSAYARAGVDIDAGERAVALMKAAVRETYTPEVLTGIGAFGGSLSVARLAQSHDLVLVATNDGVGTKTIIAESMGIYDTVGHDIVNHCVNDILVQGARPLFFLDYIAAARLDPKQVATVVGGCAAACKAVGCVLIGGETAEMPGVYAPGAFDLIGTMVGWVDRKHMIDGTTVRPGDICLGLPSSGLHTNGFSLARSALGELGWETVLPELGDQPLGRLLLTPHRCYLHDVEALWDAGITIKAMSHLTGGAYIENLPRVLPDGIGARIDRAAWEVPPIFRLIRRRAHVEEREMYRAFNMGIGMVLIVDPQEVDRALSALPELIVIGETTSHDGTRPRILLD